MVNNFLLQTEDGLLLIDTGYPGSADQLFATVRETGRDPADIRHLLLTHCHIDHAGSVAEVHRRTGTRTYGHDFDSMLITQGKTERLGTKVSPGLIPVALAGGVEIIHFPGHSAGHIALLLRQEDVLVAADLCSHVRGLGFSTVNEDITLARQSILRVADHGFEQAVSGMATRLLSKPANN